MKIIFATFSPWEKGKRSPTNGIVEPMLSYFVPKTKKFILIDQPHPGSDTLTPIIEIYHNGRFNKKIYSSILVSWLNPFLKFRNSLHTSVTFKIRDFLSVMDFGLKQNDRFDYFIGLESVNTLAGILLKKLGRVQKVIYYVTDFTPNRYQNSFLNSIYLKLDQLAFSQADFVWDVSRSIMKARFEAGLNPKTNKKPLFVPIALFENQIPSSKKTTKKIPLSIVYAGETKKENGPDLCIQAFKKVLNKFPKAQLHIFTGGGDVGAQYLRDLTDELGLHKSIFFHSLIPNQTELISYLKQFTIGIAPYRALPKSPRWWADATRIRLYLAAGLPVITTPVPPISQELFETESGLVVKDNVGELSKAIITLLNNKKMQASMQKNALSYTKNNTWNKVYDRTLKSMGIAKIS